MLRHIVLQQWRPEVGVDDRAATVAELRELVFSLPGVVNAVVAEDLGLADGNFDAALVVDFADEDAWRAYQQAPAHRAFITERLAPRLARRSAVQLPLES